MKGMLTIVTGLEGGNSGAPNRLDIEPAPDPAYAILRISAPDGSSPHGIRLHHSDMAILAGFLLALVRQGEAAAPAECRCSARAKIPGSQHAPACPMYVR